MVRYQLTNSITDLEEILALQKKNLPHNISNLEKKEQGFVTVQHSIDMLQKMHEKHPHVIAKNKTKIVGYALCMLQEFKKDIPVLTPMFKEIDSVLDDKNYLIMGQICIDKEYRQKGVFRGLYNFMKLTVKKDFTKIITEVDAKNSRSSNAHLAIGFKILKTYVSNNQEWELIALNT